MEENFILENILRKKTNQNILAIQIFIRLDNCKCIGFFVNNMQRPIFYYFKNPITKNVDFFYDIEQANTAIKEEKVVVDNYDVDILSYLSFISLFEQTTTDLFKQKPTISVFETPQHQNSIQRIKDLYSNAKKMMKLVG